jgi:ABC-2 type transport system permease protein
LQASSYFTIVDVVSTDHGIEQAFREGRIREAVLFPAGFGSTLVREGSASVRLVADATDPNIASAVVAYTTSVLGDHMAELSAGMPREGVVITPEVSMRYNPELRSVNLFVPGLIAVVLMLVSALMTSITIVREKEMGTMEILLVSPLRPWQITVGKVLPYVALSLVNLATILVLARLVFQVPVRGSVVLLVAESMLFIVCALALGILISTKASTLQAATMVALAGLLLPTVILSGFIFPIESMPQALQWFSHIVPAKWFLIIIRGIMLQGSGLEHLWKETLVLIGMTALLLTVSIRGFNVRLER